MNQNIDNIVRELENDLEKWNILYTVGGDDPLWSDGVNLNLIRNHVIVNKLKIEKLLEPEEYPTVYYQNTPYEVDDDYMAKPDEIRKKAKQTLETWKNYFFFDELKNAEYYLSKYQFIETGIQSSVNRVHILENAIHEDDLVTMRRLSNQKEEQMINMKKAYERLKEINMQEEKQIFFEEVLR